MACVVGFQRGIKLAVFSFNSLPQVQLYHGKHMLCAACSSVCGGGVGNVQISPGDLYLCLPAEVDRNGFRYSGHIYAQEVRV